MFIKNFYIPLVDARRFTKLYHFISFHKKKNNKKITCFKWTILPTIFILYKVSYKSASINNYIVLDRAHFYKVPFFFFYGYKIFNETLIQFLLSQGDTGVSNKKEKKREKKRSSEIYCVGGSINIQNFDRVFPNINLLFLQEDTQICKCIFVSAKNYNSSHEKTFV